MINYVLGRRNLAATLFVPFDCDNNCPFCTSKAMYKKEEMNFENMLKTIDIINGWKMVREYVITGGEPFADISKLERIVKRCEKPVYINTTLPLMKAADAITFINNCDEILGVNISRQFDDDFYKDIVAPIEAIEVIDKPKRINVLCTKDYQEKLELFAKKYGVLPSTIINLRADYRKITTDTLKNRDEVVKFLANKYYYVGGGSCLVCNTEGFIDEENKITIQYHRGLQYSAVRCENKTYINDVIVKPNGKMYDDWDFKYELSNDSLK